MEVLIILETNGIADYVMNQDRNIVYLVKLASEGKLKIYAPEISFREIFSVYLRRVKQRKQRIHDFRSFCLEVGRTEQYKENTREIKKNLKTLDLQFEKDLRTLEVMINELKGFVEPIPMSPETFMQAYLHHLDGRYDLSLPDSMIYVTIKNFAESKDKSIHMNKNVHDFDKAIIREELKKLNCELYFNSGEVVKRARELIP